MVTPAFVDHRRAPRVNVELPVLRKVHEQFVAEKALNLSATGLALATSAPLTPGSVENLVLSSADGRVEVTVQAEVVRVQTGAGAEYVAGLRFAALDLSATSRIEQLMLDAMRTPSGLRKGPRVEVHTEAFWSGPGASGHTHFEMVNFSHTGARIRGELVPPMYAQGLFSVRDEQSGDMLTVPAEIVWRRNEQGELTAGLRFHPHPSAADLVTQMVRSFLFLPRAVTAEESTGVRIGGFELGSLFTRGRATEVYRAKAMNPDVETAGASDVALKRFVGTPDEVAEWTQRFLAAVELGRHVHEHPGVARIYSAMGDGRECWLATELVRGSSLEEGLAEVARKAQSVPIDAVLSVVREVLATLDDCHRFIRARDGAHLEVLHGDLRPSNVLINAAGEVKLTGFGSPFRRTPEYLPWLPPEVLAGRAPTAQSDLYQAGVLLYEALTGVVPFRAETQDHLALAISVGPVPPSRLNREVPPELDRLVIAALNEDPEARPAGCAAFAEELLKLGLSPQVLSAGRARLALVRTREITADRETGEPVRPPQPTPSSFRRGQLLHPWSPTRSALTPGEVVGRYTILGKLAEGGMAEVFLARAADGKTLCLKTIFAGEAEERDVVTRFMNEARLASIISHPNVAQIYDVGFDRGRPFIAMEYVEGRTLHDVLEALDRRRHRFPAALAAHVVGECCAGLDHAHALRVVHRDVSARNILIGYDGAVKLLDFGIARTHGAQQTTSPGRVRGTSGYVAPEQVSNDPVTGRADLWALGVNLYQMLTGALPFKGKSDFAIFTAVLESEPIPAKQLRPDAPPQLCEMIDRALQKKSADRYPTAQLMRADVERYLDGFPVTKADLARLMTALFPEESRMEAKAFAVPPRAPMPRA